MVCAGNYLVAGVVFCLVWYTMRKRGFSLEFSRLASLGTELRQHTEIRQVDARVCVCHTHTHTHTHAHTPFFPRT
jgi:hypothetical protein